MKVDYATYINNHLLNDKMIAPTDLFTRSMVQIHKLKNMHIFGYPVYGLDPVLQASKKLRQWQPCSRKGILLGLALDTPVMVR